MGPRAPLFLLLLGASAVAAAPASSDPVIPPGQEALLSQLLGKGVDLPGGCHWAGASIERTTVTSQYTCGAETRVLTLCHPSAPCAASATATTTSFALSGDALPRPLVEAIAALIREGEGRFAWDQAPNEVTTVPDTVPWLAFGAAACALVFGALAALLIRRRLARATSTRAWFDARPPGFRLAASALLILLGCMAGHAALRAWGSLLSSILTLLGQGSPSLFAQVVGLAAGVGGVVGLVSTLRAPGSLAVRVGAIVALSLAVSWPLSLVSEQRSWFGTIATHTPSNVLPSPINSHGFRGPEWPLEKPPGMLRIVVIGDSFVEGESFASDADTLGAQLATELRRRFPERPLEVLNLGIAGDRLASHVELYAQSTARLAPDLVVLCLRPPSDLTAWDGQTQGRDAGRLSAWSLGRWLLGDGADALAGQWLVPTQTGAREMAFATAQFTRLGQLRGPEATRPGLVLFSFRHPDGELSELSRTALGTPLRAAPPREATDFGPDGEPTAAGNLRFAATLADAIAGDPIWQRLLAPAP